MYSSTPKPANRLLSVLLLSLGAVLAGALLGFLLVKLPVLLQVLSLFLVAAGSTLLMMRVTALTVAAFYMTYVLQSTVFGNLSFPEGAYYPLYLIMLLNIAVLLFKERLKAPWFILSSYALFYLFTLLGLAGVTELDRDVWQRLFILGLGFLVFFQFQTLKSAQFFLNTTVAAGLALSIWVVSSSVQTQFAYRGGVDSNQNVFAFFLAFAIVAVFAKLLSQPSGSFFAQAVRWLSLIFLTYGMFLFASRGMSVATGAAALVMLSRVALKPRISVPLIVGVTLVAVTVLNLPGSQGLLERFAGDDVVVAGGRAGLWGAIIREFLAASPLEVVFGQGFLASRTLLGGSTHNGYLLVLTDSGLVGLLLFLALHLVAIRFLWAYRDTLSLYSVGAVVVLMLANMTSTLMNNFIYWVVIGHVLAIASLNFYKREKGALRQEPGTT